MNPNEIQQSDVQQSEQSGENQGDAGQEFVTPDQLKEAISQVANASMANSRKMIESIMSKLKQPEPPAEASKESDSETPPTWAKQLIERVGRNEEINGRREFENQLSELGYSKGQAKALFKLYQKDQPDDLGDFLEEYKDGIAPTLKESEEQTTEKPRQDRRPTRVGAPSSLSDLDRSNVNPNKLTAEQVNLMGPEKLEKYVSTWFKNNG